MEDYKLIGKRLMIARKDKDMTIEQVADRINMSKSTISRYENGLVENMNTPILQTLADIYNVNILWLLGKSEVKEINKNDIKKNTNSIPLLGRIAAGSPILAEENIEDYFNLDSSIRADFCLKIKGDSMIDEGIYNNDIVFIRKQDTLENGQIGAILIEDEATLKTFYKEDGTVILQPANKEYKPIIFTNGNIRVLGRLVAVLNIRN